MTTRIGHMVLAAAMLTIASATWADTKDYEFQLLSHEVKKGKAIIAVKLVHKPSGRAVADAMIVAKRLDMGPEKMASMQAKLDPMAGGEPAGRWALTLGAKVPGETATIQSKLIVTSK
jgi:hypothetical protein